MSAVLSPDEFRALGYDPVASAKLGRAVRLTADAPVTATRGRRLWAPYASKWEARYAGHLATLQLAGQVLAFEYEPDVLVCAGGTKYKPDFRVTLADGTQQYHEVKGFWRKSDRVRVREASAVSTLPIVEIRLEHGAWQARTISEGRTAA